MPDMNGKLVARPWQPQDLIDDLQGIIDEECDAYLNTRRTTLCMARDYLKEHFAEQEWISAKDRLPEGFTSCIVYRKGIYGGHFSMLRYSQELGWHFYDSEWGDVTVNDVTHWMPLPQPPKGE
jgi:hypothetical protein